MMSKPVIAIAGLVMCAGSLCAADNWLQFRGPNATGISDETNLPVEFGPQKNVVWRTPVPPGHSSPCVTRDKIFLTAAADEKLFTYALDRASGRILWHRQAPRPRIQEFNDGNSPVSATPVSDGRNVYVFFADFGLLAYGPDGNELWRLPLGPFKNPQGQGSSPVLAGDTLLMQCDDDTNAFLIAVDKESGGVRWRVERTRAMRGYSTPVFYQPEDGGLQVVVAGSYRLSGHDIETGREIWWVNNLPWQIKPTPIVTADVIYFSATSGGSAPGQQEKVPDFAEALQQRDADGDGKISPTEFPEQRERWEYADLDHTGYIEELEWEKYRLGRLGENGLRAYRLGGTGDLTDSNFLWKDARLLGNVPSPTFYQGVLYTLKEGGIFASRDPVTGEILKSGRLSEALGRYSASPTAAEGKLYLINHDGVATVIRATADWEVLAYNHMGEGSHSSIAIAGGRLYLRTYEAMYCIAKLD
jgi:outer membrane protein assembly factor BamB